MKFLVLDQGNFVEQASALSAKGKHEVIYYSSWQRMYPKYHDYAPGVNFDYLRKEKYFFKWVEWADCIVNFHVMDNDAIAYLRRKYPQKSIFGSGEGEVLENDRWKLKKTIQSLGLPMQKSYHIIGIERLKEFIKTHPKHYIKINIFRADCESFYAKDYKFVEGKLNDLENKFYPNEDEIEFVAEEAIDTEVEIGFDGFFNGTDYTDKSFCGYEYHKSLYIAKVFNTRDLPEAVKDTMTRLKPVLSKMDFRGGLSTEEKIVSTKKHYFLDICSRLAYPLSSGYPEWIKNWPEVVYKLGKKEDVKLDIPYKYVGCMPLEADGGQDDAIYIDVKKEDKDKVKLIVGCKDKEGKYYSLPAMNQIVTLVAGGNSVDEVLSKLKASAKLVDADGLDKDSVKNIDFIKEIIKNGQALGINFS